MTLIDTAAAALILQMGQRQVRNLVADGTLTNHGTPRRIRLDIDEVDHHAQTRRNAHLRDLTDFR
jgi:hypothetical protein